MKTIDLLQETYTALSANKARTSLTMLGIIIGIGSVVAMLAIGQGAQNSIQSSIQSIGSNLIMIMPGVQRGPGFQASSGRGTAKSLTNEDAEAISKDVPNILAVSPEVSGRHQVTARGANTNTSVIGVNSAYSLVRNIETTEGVFISDQNVRSGGKVAVLGPATRDDLFGAGVDAVGQKIRIKDIQFTIIGITKAKGGGGFGGNPDDTIFVPISTAQRYFSGDQYVSVISVQAKDGDSTTLVQQDITALLRERHNIKEEEAADFSVFNQAEIAATASSITSIFTILLGSIAGISLVVGGIGIMNMMLTTVTERTREIGLRKAIGAKKRDISLQFLVEAVALTFIGGVIGVALGWGISSVVSFLGLIQGQMTATSVLLAFGVSAGIGILFGYYPARRAASLNPIEALRYE